MTQAEILKIFRNNPDKWFRTYTISQLMKGVKVTKQISQLRRFNFLYRKTVREISKNPNSTGKVKYRIKYYRLIPKNKISIKKSENDVLIDKNILNVLYD